jgi:two-component system, NarL family, invasion response regulator UvrY
MRVLVADDHPILRKGLRQILSEEPDIEVDEVGTIPALREYMARAAPDVLVLDVNMPGGSGLEVLSEILKLYPRLPVLVLSVHPEEQAGVRAMLSGARGYLNKEAAPERLVEAVRRLKAGGRLVSAELAEAMADYLQRPAGQRLPHETLSERELAVFKLIARGQGPSEIAASLHLSPKTVSTYRSRILEKMGMSSNADLTRYLLEHGLDESHPSP